MDRPVVLAALRDSAASLAVRFPYMRVVLKRGVFWHYLEERRGPFPLEADLGVPCARFPAVRRDPEVIRIFARGNRIAVEFSHIVTDGVGGRRFFAVLLEDYLARVDGRREDSDRLVAPPDDRTRTAETEFAYRRFYAPDLPRPPRLSRAWHQPGVRLHGTDYRVTTLVYSLSDIRGRAARAGVNVTEYIIAHYLVALQAAAMEARSPRRRRRGLAPRRPIRILVPVDLRALEGSSTVRNFFVFVMVELDVRLGTYQFAEITQKVHHQLRTELDLRSLRRHVTRNVRPERNALVRLIPVRIKDIILRAAHRRSGEAANTTSFSNLMALPVPEAVARHVRHVAFVPLPSAVTGVNATLFSVGDAISLTFGSKLADAGIERRVAQGLAAAGMRGRVITNWGVQR